MPDLENSRGQVDTVRGLLDEMFREVESKEGPTNGITLSESAIICLANLVGDARDNPESEELGIPLTSGRWEVDGGVAELLGYGIIIRHSVLRKDRPPLISFEINIPRLCPEFTERFYRLRGQDASWECDPELFGIYSVFEDAAMKAARAEGGDIRFNCIPAWINAKVSGEWLDADGFNMTGAQRYSYDHGIRIADGITMTILAPTEKIRVHRSIAHIICLLPEIFQIVRHAVDGATESLRESQLRLAQKNREIRILREKLTKETLEAVDHFLSTTWSESGEHSVGDGK